MDLLRSVSLRERSFMIAWMHALRSCSVWRISGGLEDMDEVLDLATEFASEDRDVSAGSAGSGLRVLIER
jgi:hypothetical protein